MKVLHVNDVYNSLGGAQQYMLESAQLLAEVGHESAILYLRASNRPAEEKWSAYHVPDDDLLRYRVRQVVEWEQPDIAFIHQVSSVPMIKVVNDLLPTIAYVHSFDSVCAGSGKYHWQNDKICRRKAGWSCLPIHYLCRCSAARDPRTAYRLVAKANELKTVLKRVPRILVASSFMKDLLVQNGFETERLEVLGPHFISAEREVEFAEAENPPTVLFAGRLEREKGLPYLLRAFSLISSLGRLVIAGTGSLLTEYEALVDRLGLTRHVSFVGWMNTNALGTLFQRSSFLVMPSIWPEPFGKVGIESLAHGRPVIAFDVGGIHEWLGNGVNGYLVNALDERELAAKMERLLTQPCLAAQMGREGQKVVFTRFSATEHRQRLLSILDSALGQ